MKKFRSAVSICIAVSALLSILTAGGCRAQKKDSVNSEEASSTTYEETTEVPTTEGTTEISEETSEETSEQDTTSSENISETSSGASDPGDPSSGVKAHWDAYQPGTKQADVIHRIQDGPISDITPSSDYGYVIPFLGIQSTSEEEWNSNSKVGFINSKGELICDPVFSDYFPIKGGYIVRRYYPETEAQFGKYLLGYLSNDGTVYSGTKYDAYDIVGDDLILFQTTFSDVTYITFDRSTGKASEPKTLKAKVDLHGMEPEEYYQCYYPQNICILKGRYVAYLDEMSSVMGLYDGTTGNKLDLPIKDYYPHLLGNFLWYSIYDYEKDIQHTKVYDPDGNLLFEDVGLSRLGENILIHDNDFIRVLDPNGNTLASLDKKDLPQVENVFVKGEDVFVITTKEGLIYDSNLKQVLSIPGLTTDSTNFVYSANYRVSESDPPRYLENYSYSSNSKVVTDIETGTQVQIDAEQVEYIPNTSYILGYYINAIPIDDYDYTYSYTWQIIDMKDGSTVLSNEELSEEIAPLYDRATSKAYLYVRDYGTHEHSLIDIATGEKIFSKDNDPFLSGNDPEYAEDIYNGNILLYCPKSGFSYMIDKDGKVIFLYTAEAFDD